MRTIRTLAIAATAANMLVANPSLAWDGSVTGKIVQLDAVSDGQNYGFRVYLDNGVAMCTGGPNWSFISKAASNYDVVVSLLMSAWMAGKQITIYTSTSGGACEIGYVMARG